MAAATAACPEPLARRVGTIRVMADHNGTRRDLDEWTFDDELEGLGDSTAGVRRARGWMRVVALLVAVAILLPLLLGVLSAILD
jgi:hypothetical protein